MDEGISRVFNKQEARASLGTKIIGQKILAYDLVTSTNDLAHFLAQNNEPEGTVVFAKGQTQGRGRLGKNWVSPYGKGLYFSFILRPALLPSQASRVTLTIALGVACAIEKIHIEGISIKWPNDILIKDKKVCGILTEMSLENEKINYMVAGVGVNVNMSQLDLPSGATSLKEVTRREFDMADLSHIIIKEVDHYYGILLEGKFSEIIKKVKDFSGLILGGRVRVTWEDREIEGYAVDFDENGGLVIRRDNGLSETITAGHLVKL